MNEQKRTKEISTIKKRKQTFYEAHIKRVIDIFCALLVIFVFWWLYIIVAVMVRVKLGSPIIFKQQRPGLNERIFTLYKFRTMTDKCDAEGNLMSDEERLPAFGKWLRSTSLDEIPEVFNILRGDMSIIGPRPQLVRDMVFMTPEQRKRHSVRQGLTGLAQINGRNNITWIQKFEWDFKYIENITFMGDLKIILKTFRKIFSRDDITTAGMETAEDLGDYLLRIGQISEVEYKQKQNEVRKIFSVK